MHLFVIPLVLALLSATLSVSAQLLSSSTTNSGQIYDWCNEENPCVVSGSECREDDYLSQELPPFTSFCLCKHEFSVYSGSRGKACAPMENITRMEDAVCQANEDCNNFNAIQKSGDVQALCLPGQLGELGTCGCGSGAIWDKQRRRCVLVDCNAPNTNYACWAVGGNTECMPRGTPYAGQCRCSVGKFLHPQNRYCVDLASFTCNTLNWIDGIYYPNPDPTMSNCPVAKPGTVTKCIYGKCVCLVNTTQGLTAGTIVLDQDNQTTASCRAIRGSSTTPSTPSPPTSAPQLEVGGQCVLGSGQECCCNSFCKSKNTKPGSKGVCTCKEYTKEAGTGSGSTSCQHAVGTICTAVADCGTKAIAPKSPLSCVKPFGNTFPGVCLCPKGTTWSVSSETCA